MVLQQKLKCLRKQMGLSQLELAERLQVSRQAVSGWESGTSKPSTENLKSLGYLYDVSLEYLLCNDDSEPDHVHLKLGKEESTNDIKKKSRGIVLVLIVVGVAMAMVILYAMLSENREEIIPMEDIKGSDMVTVDDFEIEW